MNELWDDFEQFWADNDQWIWIVLAAALAIILAALVIGFVRAKKRRRDREHAEAIRHTAARQDAEIGKKDAETRRLEAQADEAQAEADRLHAIAQEKRSQLEHDRAEQIARLQKAEELENGKTSSSTPKHSTHEH